MGLDITAYSDIKLAENNDAVDEYGDVEDGFVRLYKNMDFESRADEILDGRVYSYGDSIGFRAGSYSGYNSWRSSLAKLAGYASANEVWENPIDGPFMELINFSDCEGVIGCSVCKKLARDFANYQNKADLEGGWFKDLYDQWREALDLASDNGCVEFH